MTNIAVTGGRDYQDVQKVFITLDSVAANYDSVFLIVGDATGADTFALKWAEARGIPYLKFAARWDLYGKMAGPIRNREMLDAGADVLVAFPGGRGTQGCMMEADKRMIPIVKVEQ